MHLIEHLNKTKPVAIKPDIIFGGGPVQMIAGPCAVESESQIMTAARYVAQTGARLLRGGVFKPRTRPNSFQGLGDAGLEIMTNAARQYGLAVVTELMDVRKLELFVEYEVDMIQIGSRNMQNFDLLKEVGKTNIPVMLKRGLAASLSEWLGAAEYISAGGNEQIILCERGIRSFEQSYRNTLDISAVPYLKQTTPFPVIVDPSHACGQRNLIPALSKAAIAAGADGLLVETHPNPDSALSDKEQALEPSEFQALYQDLQPITQAVGRQLS